jgi:hypothetical protein
MYRGWMVRSNDQRPISSASQVHVCMGVMVLVGVSMGHASALMGMVVMTAASLVIAPVDCEPQLPQVPVQHAIQTIDSHLIASV